MNEQAPPGDQEFDAQGFAREIHELLVFAALREGPRHGYQIALDVEAHSNGIFRFRHGTLYPILHRMEANGLILGRWSSGTGRRRKVYSLTDIGRRHLSGETDRVQEILSGLTRMLRRAREASA
ncbi:MAG: PadR family transcriptional regulator [Gammaproteobacteria bacterium]|nr:PadR family transcriptional regulator [Gammaproteobacteria bacterium]MDE0259712.1 PadR family transcriptional regulator [Gammaproteobacteria bacterium]